MGREGSVMTLALAQILSPIQVPIPGVCGRYLLLFCWHDLCCGGDLGTLQQDHAALLYATSIQFPLLAASALPHRPLPAAPHAQVATLGLERVIIVFHLG